MDLKGIKSRILKNSNGISNYINISIEEMDWLVEQAEKAERYEQALEKISCEGHSFVGEISRFCINTARKELGKQKLS